MIFLRTKFWLVVFILILINTFIFVGSASADTQIEEIQPSISSIIQENENLKSRLYTLENNLNEIESNIQNNKYENQAAAGCLMFLFGAFCALWAQNNKRNAIGWFIAGFIFTAFAVLFVLLLNRKGLRNEPN